MKSQIVNSTTFLARKYLVIVVTLFVAFAYVPRCEAQQKPGWNLIFDDEFSESSLTGAGGVFYDQTSNPGGLWTSGSGYNNISAANGGTYNVSAQYWEPYCDQPTQNTALSTSGTLLLTTREDPGYYPIGGAVSVTLSKGSTAAFVSSTSNLTVGSYVTDAQCGIPDGTTITAVVGPSQITLSKPATSSPSWDFLAVSDDFRWTGAEIGSQKRFLYGYFEIQAKIPNNGMVLWPAFWLWNGGGNIYREIDIFEFGSTSQSNLIRMNEHIARALDNGYPEPDPWIDVNGRVINNYPGTYQVPQSDDITNNFHTYAMKWTPNSVTWYFDDQPVYLLAGHSPHLDMYLIADLWVTPPSWDGVDPTNWTPPGGGPPIDLLPANYEIDYIRAYTTQTNEFMYQWGNGGSGQIGGWRANDRYISGKFEGNGKAQLLGISNVEAADMMDFNGNSWTTAWSNKFGFPNWVMQQDDKYVVGDFAGLGRDQVMAINDDNGHAQLMNYSPSSKSWSAPWSTGGGKIAWWYMHKEDQYIAGDFAGLGFDQLLAINYADGWAQLMEYYGGSWHTIWTNNGSHWISGWYLSAGDKYLPGNFQGNVNGQKGLLAIATNGDGYSALVNYSGGQWYNVWDNQGSGKIHWWYMNPTDKYLVGNFDGGNQDQLMAVAANGDGWTQLMSFSGSDWDTPWSNDGGGTIDYWYINSSDKYIAGDFNGHQRTDLLAIATNGDGWAQLMQRILPSP